MSSYILNWIVSWPLISCCFTYEKSDTVSVVFQVVLMSIYNHVQLTMATCFGDFQAHTASWLYIFKGVIFNDPKELGQKTKYFVFLGWGPSTLFDNFTTPNPQAFDKNFGSLTEIPTLAHTCTVPPSQALQWLVLLLIIIIIIIIIILHSIVFKRDWFSLGWILCNCLLCSDIIIHVHCFGHCDGPLTLYQNVIMIILQCYGV